MMVRGCKDVNGVMMWYLGSKGCMRMSVLKKDEYNPCDIDPKFSIRSKVFSILIF